MIPELQVDVDNVDNWPVETLDDYIHYLPTNTKKSVDIPQVPSNAEIKSNEQFSAPSTSYTSSSQQLSLQVPSWTVLTPSEQVASRQSLESTSCSQVFPKRQDLLKIKHNSSTRQDITKKDFLVNSPTSSQSISHFRNISNIGERYGKG